MQSEFDKYIGAFSRYMDTGQSADLLEFCPPETDLKLFAIYRNGFYRATIDALASNYPVVVKLIGEDSFSEIARQFVSEYPPRDGSLVGYGKQFPAFLRDSGINAQLPYLQAVATLDRKWLEVYFGKETTPLEPENILSVTENQELGLNSITLSSPSALVTLDYPVSDIWQKLKMNIQLTEKLILNESQEHLLIWRNLSGVMVRIVPRMEYFFLSRLIEGTGLQYAAEQALKESAEFDLELLFSNLLSAGLLTTVKPNNMINRGL